METSISPPVQSVPRSFPFLTVVLIVLVILLASAVGYLTYQNKQLRQQIRIPTTTAVTTENTNTISPENVISKIKYGGTIDKIKTVNTDNWMTTSGAAAINKPISFTYQYPNMLYTVPDIRPGFSALYFFENRNAYEKYIGCIADTKPVQRQGGGGPTRDWEGGCDLEGNLLFFVTVEMSSGKLLTLSNKPDDLTAYSGGNAIRWIVPQKDKIVGGMRLNYYADGDTGKGWLTVMVTPASEKDIARVTGIDSYTLFTHILASFRIKS